MHRQQPATDSNLDTTTLRAVPVFPCSNGDRVPENFGRPHGLLQPPVNPYLADSWKPRQHRSGLFNGGGATGGADTAGGR